MNITAGNARPTSNPVTSTTSVATAGPKNVFDLIADMASDRAERVPDASKAIKRHSANHADAARFDRLVLEKYGAAATPERILAAQLDGLMFGDEVLLPVGVPREHERPVQADFSSGVHTWLALRPELALLERSVELGAAVAAEIATRRIVLLEEERVAQRARDEAAAAKAVEDEHRRIAIEKFTRWDALPAELRGIVRAAATAKSDAARAVFVGFARALAEERAGQSAPVLSEELERLVEEIGRRKR